MVISAQLSVYPLGEENVSAYISSFCSTLAREGVHPTVGPMSTLVTGDADQVFRALQTAFEQVAGSAHVVLTATISNACPVVPPS